MRDASKNSDNLGSITIAEWCLPLFWACFIVLLGTIPYLYGYFSVMDDEVFMGFIGRGTTGTAGYMMLAEQAYEGNFLFENQITPEPATRGYFNLEWLLFGRMASFFGVSLIFMFHVWRICGVLFFVLCVFLLVAQCIQGKRLRQFSLALILFASGFGWLIVLVNWLLGIHLPLPPDVDGVTLFSHLINKPHFILGGSFAALTCAFLIMGEKSGRSRYFVYSALAASAHGFIRPFHLPETYLLYLGLPITISLLEASVNPRRFFNYALAVFTFLPVTIFLLLTAYWNVLGMDAWKSQSYYLLEMTFWLGIPFSICIIALLFGGIVAAFREHSTTFILAAWLLAAWLVANAFPYYPAGIESPYYALAIAPPILIFCGPLQYMESRLSAFRPELGAYFTGKSLTFLALVMLAFSIPSNVINYRNFFATLHAPQGANRYYLSKDEEAALLWLGQNSAPEDVLLASVQLAQFAPRISDNKVFAANEVYTPRFKEKTDQLAQFYRDPDNLTFKQWLVETFHIDYIFYGPYEKRMGDCAPDLIPWLEKVYDKGAVQVYKVRLP